MSVILSNVDGKYTIVNRYSKICMKCFSIAEFSDGDRGIVLAWLSTVFFQGFPLLRERRSKRLERRPVAR